LINLKKAVGTTDFADDADKKELKELPSERVFTLWVSARASNEVQHSLA